MNPRDCEHGRQTGKCVDCDVLKLERINAQLLEAQPELEPDAYGYASRLAVAIWEQHYKGVAPQWKPFDDLMGVLTQIDNMTAGLTAQRQPLTDEQIGALRQQYGVTSDGRGIKEFTYVLDFARAIEAAHGITGEKK